MANLLSFAILILFLWGRSLWSKNLRWHIRLMVLAFALDLALVLSLVFYRNALGTVVHGEMPLSLRVHVPIAVATIVLYLPTLASGYQLYRGDERARVRLRFFDKLLLLFRVLTLVTSVAVQISR